MKNKIPAVSSSKTEIKRPERLRKKKSSPKGRLKPSEDDEVQISDNSDG